MSTSRFTGAVGVLIFAAALAAAAGDRPYEEVMKETAAACGKVKKDLDSKDLTSAARDARDLQAGFKAIQKYWKKRKVEDATRSAGAARAAAGAVVRAARADDLAAAQASFKSVTATCKGCHDNHREKGPDGKWKVKA